MTPTAAPAKRLVLVPSTAPRRSAPLDARLRRYTLARVTSESRKPRTEGFAQLART